MAMEKYNITYWFCKTSSSELKEMMHELFALENISVHLCYVALVSFRHSKQTDIVMVHLRKKEHPKMTVEKLCKSLS